MSGGANGQEHELDEGSTHSQSCEGSRSFGRESENVKKKRWIKFVKVHVKKFLALILLIVLALVVAALHKQMMLQSDWEEGYNFTRSTIKAMNVVDHNLFSNVGVQFDDMIASSPVLIKIEDRVTTLNLTKTIQNEWNQAREELYYHKFSQNATYKQAKKYCQEWTGRLAADILRNDTVVRNMHGLPAWVGYNKFGGTWHWIDGKETNQTIIDLKALDEITTVPNGTQPECGFIQSSFNGMAQLKAATCNATMLYICEVEMNYAY